MTREEAIKALKIIREDYWDEYGDTMPELDMAIKVLEQESQTFEWCKTCREYDQEKHCCHRWSKVIRNAVEEMKQCEDAISREEAIGAVANLFEISEYPHPYPQGKPIRLKDIKEKLKQLPSVQPKPIECEDAISRKEALEALEKEEPLVWCDGADEIAAYNQWSSDVDTIKNIPSVQPKPKTGYWIHTGGHNYHCSECDFIQHESMSEYKYCPNCGAKMKSEETNADSN